MSTVVEDGGCSVSLEPSTLTFAEVARLVIRSRSPRARRPWLRHVFLVAYLAFVVGFASFWLSAVTVPGIITPVRVSLLGVVVEALPLLRLWTSINVTRKVLAGHGPSTFEVDSAGLTRRGDHWVTWISWAGVVDVRITPLDIIFLFDVGDYAWLPRRAFEDREHEAQFLRITGMAGEPIGKIRR